jgi:hypothetical protein
MYNFFLSSRLKICKTLPPCRIYKYHSCTRTNHNAAWPATTGWATDFSWWPPSICISLPVLETTDSLAAASTPVLDASHSYQQASQPRRPPLFAQPPQWRQSIYVLCFTVSRLLFWKKRNIRCLSASAVGICQWWAGGASNWAPALDCQSPVQFMGRYSISLFSFLILVPDAWSGSLWWD